LPPVTPYMVCSAGTARTSHRPGWVRQSRYPGGECTPPQVMRIPTPKRDPGRGCGVFLVSCVGWSDYCRTVPADITYNLIIYSRSLGVLAPRNGGVSPGPARHIVSARYGGTLKRPLWRKAHEKRKKRKRTTKTTWEGWLPVDNSRRSQTKASG
jgi:hypothetical protein